jgi:methyl-accepting chemotaxis protein
MRLSSLFGKAMLVGALGLVPVAARAQQTQSTTESPAPSAQQNAAKADQAAAQAQRSADQAKQAADEAKQAAQQAKDQTNQATQQASPTPTTDITIPFVP